MIFALDVIPYVFIFLVGGRITQGHILSDI